MIFLIQNNSKTPLNLSVVILSKNQVNYKYVVTLGMRVFWKSRGKELLQDKFHKYFV